MEFATFCNICFNTESEIEQNENALKILISLIGKPEVIGKSKVYLCHLCCDKLEEYNKFRNMCTKNILHFRYLYFELKNTLECSNYPDMDMKLRNFIDVKVYNKVDVFEYTNAHTDRQEDGDKKYLKCEDDVEEYKVHTEIDLGHVAETFDVPIPQDDINTHSHSEEEDVDRVESNNENEDSDKPAHTQTKIRDKLLDNGTTLNEREILYTCKTCNKIFKKSIDLRRHKYVHTGEKPYTCSVCNKAFSRSSNLKRHQRVHTGFKVDSNIKNGCRDGRLHTQMKTREILLNSESTLRERESMYTCRMCNKTFKKSVDLTRHKYVHTGEKPYTCSVCNKAFSRSSNLKRHQRVHTGEKAHRCSLGDKAFVKLSFLKKRQRVHAGELV